MRDKNHTTGSKQTEAGFALIAMIGVLGVMMITAAIVVPNMVTSLDTDAGAEEEEKLQAIAQGTSTYLRTNRAWPVGLDAHSPGYVPLDSTNLSLNDGRFGRYYAAHPTTSSFTNGAGLTEASLIDVRFLLISNLTAEAAPTITNANEFETWWGTDESSTAGLHIYRGNLASLFHKVTLTAVGDGGSYQIDGTSTNSSGGTLASYTRYHVAGTPIGLDEANSYGTPEHQLTLTSNIAFEFDPLCEAGFQWRVVPASPCSSSIVLWLSTQGTTSGAPGLDSWEDYKIVSFDTPSLTYETGSSGKTSGTFAQIADFSAFGASDIDAGHYVNASMTIGGLTLNEGDLLLSTTGDQTLTSNNSLFVNDEDVFIFRPTSSDDYSSGSFFMFMDASDVGIGDDIEAFTFVEMNTAVAGLELIQGDVLLYHDGEDIHRFVPTSLGSTTSGTVSVFFEGGDIRISEEFEGLELIEEQADLGDITLSSGQILATIELGDSDLGDNRINADVTDIFILDLTSLGDDTEGTATVVFDGADVGLTTTAEGTDSIMIKGSPSTIVALSITNPGFETGDLTGWSLTGDLEGTGGINTWGADSIPQAYIPMSAHSGTYWADGSATGATGAGVHTTGIYQRIDVSAYSSEISSGLVTVQLNGYGRGETIQDDGKFRIVFYDAVSGGNQVGSIVESGLATESDSWDILTISSTVPVGTMSIEIMALALKVDAGINNDAGVDDISGYLLLP